jgi:predicted O-methyltransferase YrrM
MMSSALKPACVLELGTFTGYSAICLARGLAAGGVLHTIDNNEELYEMAAKYIHQAGLTDRIVQHTGNATEIIPNIKGPFDMVFIDADKPNYITYYDMLIEHMAPGGMLLADNVLFEGEVLLPAAQQSKNAKAMHKFNETIKADKRVEHMLLPLRDGLMLIRKK